jgi:spoIIIJ-associated protein
VEVTKEGRRSVVASGKHVEDAIANGLQMLGVRRDQVDIEVLSEGSRGVLGFGAENARVRLVVKPKPPAQAPQPKPMARAPEPKPPASVPEPKSKAQVPSPRPAAAPVSEPRPKAQVPTPSPAAPQPAAEHPDAGQVGREILTELLRLMGVQAAVQLESSEELAEEGQPPPTVLNISGDDLGFLIGRRGETLGTLQYLVRLMVSHRLKHWTDLIVDVEHYRVRRRRALESLAHRIADRVAKDGRAQALEPMPAYERRLVHIALRNHPKVTTRSVGEGERRKVTIVPRG